MLINGLEIEFLKEKRMRKEDFIFELL